jgi:ATP-dependent DNA helicase RecQ
MRDQALELLRAAVGNPCAQFRDGQWECIERLLRGERLLVVQRTGWGKSMVYFLATRLLREREAGRKPRGLTLLVSPLLSLMRNQIEAARRIGIRADTINSTNTAEWQEVRDALQEGAVDLLLVSPERLANHEFTEEVLGGLLAHVSLLVVDEAHCISDWGHDFRPNYRRIIHIVRALPRGTPVLATTATANQRVTEDVASQLGSVTIVRGPLARDSLRLQNIDMPNPTARMAWLAQTIPTLSGSGIVYVLTVGDAERVAEWLRSCGIDAEPYHADVDESRSGESTDTGARSRREELEQRLLENKVKVLVATVALGMGFDKPDLGFVIHFQRPASVVHYYQQVGRAGRAMEEAYGVLLHGAEDDDIAGYFRANAFPPQENADAILKELQNADGGMSIAQIEARLNLPYRQIEKALTYMSVEDPAPVTKLKKWQATPSSADYKVDRGLVDQILGNRVSEQAQMGRYMEHTGCLMEFLARTLDDPTAGPCGVCEGCRGVPVVPTAVDDALANRAAIFLKRGHVPLEPRALWPQGALPLYGFSGRIGDGLRAEEGRILCTWRDAGWGGLVAEGKYTTLRFDDRLVQACAAMVREWAPSPAPQWVTCIPSLERPELVPDFARRLADALSLPLREVLRKVAQNKPQKEMQNSFQQARNLDGVFEVGPGPLCEGPCLLVDDVVDSRWTMTVAAALLRRAGCSAVFPLALGLNSLRSE